MRLIFNIIIISLLLSCQSKEAQLGEIINYLGTQIDYYDTTEGVYYVLCYNDSLYMTKDHISPIIDVKNSFIYSSLDRIIIFENELCNKKPNVLFWSDEKIDSLIKNYAFPYDEEQIVIFKSAIKYDYQNTVQRIDRYPKDMERYMFQKYYPIPPPRPKSF